MELDRVNGSHSPTAMQSAMAGKEEDKTQTVFVIRHGERIDHVDPHWVQKNERYYDPPLTKLGEGQAKEAGKVLKGKEKVSIIILISCSCSASE